MMIIIDEGPCTGSTCLNGGRCIGDRTNHVKHCVCPADYSGDKCQIGM